MFARFRDALADIHDRTAMRLIEWLLPFLREHHWSIYAGRRRR